MSKEPVDVVPVDLPVAEPAAGGVACDPTYVGPGAASSDVARAASKETPSLGPLPAPASSIEWGEIPEGVIEHGSIAPGALDARANTPSELPDLPPEPALPKTHGMPVEFDPVDAPDLELDLPRSSAPTIRSTIAKRRRGPTGSSVDPGPSVLIRSKFWERLPLAFVAPILGKASILLVLAGLLPAIASLVMTVDDLPFVAKLVLFAPGLLFSLGLLSEAFARLAQEGAENDEGTPSPTLGDTDVYSIVGAGAGTFFMGLLLFVFPVWLLWRGAIPLWLFLGLSFVPYIYWPMALTVGSVTSNVVAMFDIPLVLRAMFRAPLKYLVVVALGFVLTAALSFGGSFALMALGIATGPHPILIPISTFVLFSTITYLHAVLGYAMGRLVTTEDRLADLLTKR